jgi:putative tryptophan/tyrosine transport system substrate-binding protein
MGVNQPARMVIVTLVVALLAFLGVSTTAGQPTRVHRVGMLLSTSPAAASHVTDAFDDAMRERGWVPGKNLLIERRWAEGRPERFPEQAADLLLRKVDVIVASSQPAAVAARRATTTLPIVMVNAADPVGAGLVASLAQPGGNVTGIAAQLTPEIRAKQLQLIREALPGIPRVVVLRRAATARAPEWAEYPPTAQALGLRLQFRDVQGADDLGAAVAAIARERPVVLLVPGGDTLFFTLREQIVALAREHSLPGFYGVREFVEAGGLMSYSAPITDQWRRAAAYVDRILKGARAATLPVESPTQFELVINLRTAKELGLALPQAMLIRADEVIR